MLGRAQSGWRGHWNRKGGLGRACAGTEQRDITWVLLLKNVCVGRRGRFCQESSEFVGKMRRGWGGKCIGVSGAKWGDEGFKWFKMGQKKVQMGRREWAERVQVMQKKVCWLDWCKRFKEDQKKSNGAKGTSGREGFEWSKGSLVQNGSNGAKGTMGRNGNGGTWVRE